MGSPDKNVWNEPKDQIDHMIDEQIKTFNLQDKDREEGKKVSGENQKGFP